LNDEGEEMTALEHATIGALTGAAIGDALGGATEGYSPEQIQRRYGGFVEGIVPPFNPDWQNARPVSPFHKGDGHITDDSLMTESLVSVYSHVGDHLDAYSFAAHIIPELIEKKRWIPELHQETLLIHRVFHAEKWLVHKLHHSHADPREAGVGNMVNCGATMYMAPVGIVNAGAPEAAYKEAIDIAGAHQSSYGREAAGVFAAAVAAAITPQTKVDEILEIAVDLAHDGTKSAIQTILKTAETISDWRAGLQELRRSIAPFDSMAEAYREPGPDARKPSRLRAIEELPIALAILKITRGNFKEGVLGAINYGRDSDSIATMLGAISGAMNGRNSIPEDWVETVERESKRDFLALGKTMAAIARNIAEKDAARESRVALAREKIYSNPPLYRAK
jgi:ADP-ribosylglycohydrolase